MTDPARFPKAVKSTLDFHADLIAQQLGIASFDLDGAATLSDLLESDQTALGWALNMFVEQPRDPCWYLEFDIGGKTSKDPAQYVSMEIASRVTSVFRSGAEFEVMDYTGEELPTERLGVIVVAGAGITPAQYDRVSGLRLVNVRANVLRYVQ